MHHVTHLFRLTRPQWFTPTRLSMALLIACLAWGQAQVFAQTGVIAFASFRDGNEEIYIVSDDGATEQRITNNPAADARPAISPDGQQIAFISDRTGRWELYTIGIDGSGLTQLTVNLPTDAKIRGIDWHPDGSKLILPLYQNNIDKLYEIGADGSGLMQLVSETVNGTTLDVGIAHYNQDGTRIVMIRNVPFNSFTARIWVANADGSGMTQLTTFRSGAPDWVFDGGVEKIVFQTKTTAQWQLYLMEADGSNPVNISNNSFEEEVVSGPDGPGEIEREGIIVFRSKRNGLNNVWMRGVDGTNEVQLTTAGGSWPDWWAAPLNEAPVADAGPDQPIECADPNGTLVSLDGTASSDPDDDPLIYTWTGPFGTASGPTPTVTMPLGVHTITLTVDDGNSGTDTDEVVVTVEDTTAPVITVQAEPIVLWPPNHKYHTIDLSQIVTGVADACDANVSAGDVVVASATSDEPENGQGDGNTTDDIVIGGDCQSVDLRAERQGGGNGRVYTIHLAVTDASGNEGTASYQVHVPHNKKSGAVDDGSSYTVDGCSPTPLVSVAFGNGQQPKVAMIESEEAPGAFSLEQNYPNPFNPVTTIAYSLPVSQHVIVTLFDVLGREVATLVNRQKTPGRHEVVFDAGTLPSGVYLYRLQAGPYIETKKLLLAK